MEHLAAITQEEANSLRKKEVAGQLMFYGVFFDFVHFQLVAIFIQSLAYTNSFVSLSLEITFQSKSSLL